MTAAEVNSVQKLKKTTTEPVVDEEHTDSFAERALKRSRITTVSSNQFINTNFLLPTSNDVERLFSMSKRIFTVKRRSLARSTLEALMFLNRNRALWNQALVGAIVNSNETDDNLSGDEEDSCDSDDEY